MPAGDWHDCPTGCGRRAAPNRLMCGPCWGEVPGKVQRDVNRTWRELRKLTLSGLFHPDNAGIRAAYREARDAAIGSVG